jgi:spoIIIJ-associated protein
MADHVRQLLRKMGFDTSVEAQAQDDELWIRIRVEDEEDAFLLHGRRGETRAALQHLLQRVLLPRTEGGPTVLVDINDQWVQRLEDLRGEALDLARRAVEEGRPLRTRPLPSEERRIIHRALADRGDVRTHSEGDSREKRVVITPAGSQD